MLQEIEKKSNELIERLEKDNLELKNNKIAITNSNIDIDENNKIFILEQENKNLFEEINVLKGKMEEIAMEKEKISENCKVKSEEIKELIKTLCLNGEEVQIGFGLKSSTDFSNMNV